ncbi:transposase [Flammeovirga aprica]|uniref:Transposase n=1 Tax=Flammeovirga aprica JL-4 TaxID=694437 RepID=A0A7X9S2A0_9BACT|nr:transposase [Flammeovirga aprica]NME72999.1 transposase [Flammeovirga aprica JL-4]
MLKTGKVLRSQRKFSEEFKRKIVHEYEFGQLSIKSISEQYSISLQTVYRWIHQYSNYNNLGVQVVEMKNSQEHKLKVQQKKIEELERVLGQKQLYLEYLEKVIELADEEYNIDIKKNSETLQSGGSKITKTR